MASAREAASSIARWAINNNLLGALHANMDSQYLDPVAAATFSQEALDILRHRSVSSIVFNEVTATVYVYTDKKVTVKETEMLPKVVLGCSVAYPQGPVDEIGGPVENAQGSAFTMANGPTNTGVYCCGSSISPGNEASAGTLGALVRKSDGSIYGLTNNHVTGGCNHSAIDLPILAPGVFDVAARTIIPFTIGFHSEVLPFVTGTAGNVSINDNTDAALFKISDASWVTSRQGHQYDTPANAVAPAVGMKVQKVGRTTGHTTGTIVGQQLRPIRVQAQSQRNRFQAIITMPNVYVVHGDYRPFSDSGDSGSLVVTNDDSGTNYAVGIIMSGGPDSTAPGGKKTSILPIAPILKGFNVTLVSGHNVT
ncbi:Nal1-like putative serine protease [Paraburkholderia tropica]|uniref:hypothetical protein n=1 Tax=Paraburkholderia tropica TaxID=92647 RepID=UPI002ABD14EF|nr:hypothetical protein [Paraburkholderia tropica]